MNTEQLNKMRRTITGLIDDVKYQSDSLTDMERLPIIQLKIILTKINKLTEHTTILLHYIELEGKLSDKGYSTEIKDKTDQSVAKIEELITENKIESENVQKDVNAEELEKALLLDSDKNPNDSGAIDLKVAIGINEKYLFSSELFNGSTDDLSKAINDLNQMTEKKSVQSYLKNLEKEYNWNIENEIVQNFIEIIERKFD